MAGKPVEKLGRDLATIIGITGMRKLILVIILLLAAETCLAAWNPYSGPRSGWINGIYANKYPVGVALPTAYSPSISWSNGELYCSFSPGTWSNGEANF